MEYIIPHYFEKFRCVAAECEDTCCAGWAIMIDEESLEKYKNMEGALGNRVRNSIDWENGSFCQYEKRCAFLNEDNLCDLHMEAGEHMLCKICRDYPRHMEEYEGLREGSLSLSCIEAAKIILGCKEPVQFLRFEDEVEDEEYEDFDFLLFTKLMDARDKIIDLLQNREIDIMVRIGLCLEFAQKMQEALESNELFKVDEMLEQFGNMDAMLAFQKKIDENKMGENEYCQTVRKMFRIFGQLEVLKDDWPDYVKRAEKHLFSEGQSGFKNNDNGFHKAYGLKSAHNEEWSIWLEQLMVYFVFTYFCGAVYDEQIVGKMQIAVVTTFLIQELTIAKWIENDESMDFNQFVDIAHRVSRELEHSDVNLVRFEKICKKTSIFQSQQLLRVVLY
ncbi:MAG: flagellin lysine-N-methylase [Tyzzerella sp.]|nr:flagellin lysine-N-methylase [Tyzzerella sp.]